jgi:diaminopimelate decarboxylase
MAATVAGFALQETVFQAQAAQLAAAIPQLFAPGCPIQLATENGRSLLAKAGFTASR